MTSAELAISALEQQKNSIATHVHNCLNGFQKTCDGFINAEQRIRNKLPLSSVTDELGRFKLWSGNAGAHRRGRASLDYKLREASHIRDRVIELLQNLNSVLEEATDIITGKRLPWEELSDSDSDFSDAEGDEASTTELAQLSSNINEIVTCLMRLSVAIRNPAPHDQFKDSSNVDITHFEPFDIEHVRGKFPKAKGYLVSRLGKAVSRRRQYLRYREEHRKKFDRGLDEPKAELQQPAGTLPQAAFNPPTILSKDFESTVASSLPLLIKTNASIVEIDQNEYYEDTLSQTSYASSSHDPSRLRPPALPAAGEDGDPFECPLCFRFTSVRNSLAWYKHVYRDLQPYVCTFEHCETPDRIYGSRHEWFHHEQEAHGTSWQCIDGCNQRFWSEDTIRTHLLKVHSDVATTDRVDDLVRNGERHDEFATKLECSLCFDDFHSLAVLRRHVGKHHEELSLFALPSHMKDDHEHDDDSESPVVDEGSVSGSSNDGEDQENTEADTVDAFQHEKFMIMEYPEDGLGIPSCAMPNCGAVFEKARWKEDLPLHWKDTHKRSIHVCNDSECLWTSRFQDSFLKHLLTHHPKLAHNEACSAFDDYHAYYERLLEFRRETKNIADSRDVLMYLLVGNHTITLEKLVETMFSHGGFGTVRRYRAFGALGHSLGLHTSPGEYLSDEETQDLSDHCYSLLSKFESHVQEQLQDLHNEDQEEVFDYFWTCCHCGYDGNSQGLRICAFPCEHRKCSSCREKDFSWGSMRKTKDIDIPVRAIEELKNDRSRDARGCEFSVFVGNLGPEATEFSLVRLFHLRYPSAKSAKIISDRNIGMSRRYGFVRFANEEEQQKALTEMQDFYYADRPMRISIATPKNKRDDTSGPEAAISESDVETSDPSDARTETYPSTITLNSSEVEQDFVDDDIFDPDLFKRRAAGPVEARAEDIYTDFLTRYNQEDMSQADFFRPKELSERDNLPKIRLVEPNEGAPESHLSQVHGKFAQPLKEHVKAQHYNFSDEETDNPDIEAWESKLSLGTPVSGSLVTYSEDRPHQEVYGDFKFQADRITLWEAGRPNYIIPYAEHMKYQLKDQIFHITGKVLVYQDDSYSEKLWTVELHFDERHAEKAVFHHIMRGVLDQQAKGHEAAAEPIAELSEQASPNPAPVFFEINGRLAIFTEVGLYEKLVGTFRFNDDHIAFFVDAVPKFVIPYLTTTQHKAYEDTVTVTAKIIVPGAADTSYSDSIRFVTLQFTNSRDAFQVSQRISDGIARTPAEAYVSDPSVSHHATDFTSEEVDKLLFDSSMLVEFWRKKIPSFMFDVDVRGLVTGDDELSTRRVDIGFFESLIFFRHKAEMSSWYIHAGNMRSWRNIGIPVQLNASVLHDYWDPLGIKGEVKLLLTPLDPLQTNNLRALLEFYALHGSEVASIDITQIQAHEKTLGLASVADVSRQEEAMAERRGGQPHDPESSSAPSAGLSRKISQPDITAGKDGTASGKAQQYSPGSTAHTDSSDLKTQVTNVTTPSATKPDRNSGNRRAGIIRVNPDMEIPAHFYHDSYPPKREDGYFDHKVTVTAGIYMPPEPCRLHCRLDLCSSYLRLKSSNETYAIDIFFYYKNIESILATQYSFTITGIACDYEATPSASVERACLICEFLPEDNLGKWREHRLDFLRNRGVHVIDQGPFKILDESIVPHTSLSATEKLDEAAQTGHDSEQPLFTLQAISILDGTNLPPGTYLVRIYSMYLRFQPVSSDTSDDWYFKYPHIGYAHSIGDLFHLKARGSTSIEGLASNDMWIVSAAFNFVPPDDHSEMAKVLSKLLIGRGVKVIEDDSDLLPNEEGGIRRSSMPVTEESDRAPPHDDTGVALPESSEDAGSDIDPERSDIIDRVKEVQRRFDGPEDVAEQSQQPEKIERLNAEFDRDHDVPVVDDRGRSADSEEHDVGTGSTSEQRYFRPTEGQKAYIEHWSNEYSTEGKNPISGQESINRHETLLHAEPSGVSKDTPESHPQKLSDIGKAFPQISADSEATSISKEIEVAKPTQQTAHYLLRPIRACVPQYCFADDVFWFLVECQLEDGRCWELQRWYQDFYDLQIRLIAEYPVEAGTAGSQDRTLPFIPGPVTYVTDKISNGRRQYLDEYVKDLLKMGLNITDGPLVKNFFAPREGDHEIGPGEATWVKLSKPRKRQEAERERESEQKTSFSASTFNSKAWTDALRELRACHRPGCEVETSQRYCDDHRCAIIGCLHGRDQSSILYCTDHITCKKERCTNSRRFANDHENLSPFCVDHWGTCRKESCFEWVHATSGMSRFCAKHTLQIAHQDELQAEESGSQAQEKASTPKPNHTAYFFFASANRQQVRDDNAGMTSGQIGKLLGEIWKGLPDEQRAIYEAMATADKTRYEREREDYDEDEDKLEEDEAIQDDEELPAIEWPPGRRIDPQSLSTPRPAKLDISADVVSNPGESVPAVSDGNDDNPQRSRTEPEKSDHRAKDSGVANEQRKLEREQSMAKHERADEVHLRVDNNAPISLQLTGDMADRTLQVIPGENGTTEIVFANPDGGESVYTKSERDSVVGRNRRSMVGGQPRREAEEYTERSSRSSRTRREDREGQMQSSNTPSPAKPNTTFRSSRISEETWDAYRSSLEREFYAGGLQGYKQAHEWIERQAITNFNPTLRQVRYRLKQIWNCQLPTRKELFIDGVGDSKPPIMNDQRERIAAEDPASISPQFDIRPTSTWDKMTEEQRASYIALRKKEIRESHMENEDKTQVQQGKTPLRSLQITAPPTYAKVHRQYLDVETLHYYDIPYELSLDSEYYIILQEMSQTETEVLFEHTRRLRSQSDSKPLIETESKAESTFVITKSKSRSSSDASGARQNVLDRSLFEEDFERTEAEERQIQRQMY